MKKYVMYTSIWVYDNEGISVLFPALPGCCTCGRAEVDTKLMAKDALKIWCETKINELHEELPKDLELVELSKWVAERRPEWGKRKWKARIIMEDLEVEE